MISERQIVLFKFHQTNQKEGKLRPALILRKLPGKFNDWLICMISSNIDQQIPELDELIAPEDSDFIQSGLKMPSIIRAGRLAVVDGSTLIGTLGQINTERLHKINVVRLEICGYGLVIPEHFYRVSSEL
ncbi:MAG: type II toxin-antitoxin system PemK/MazF family toxin [Planctomycetia bacterium]|nr:type II toxin-antitoxin system PemK/MazF family toxin [Candidatus Brocadia sp.]QOJ07880.1 MAG: type II toxin-antitoxin system PemK/MazF family toxin [Planctomycetia bacterium]TVL97228.1 MAG: PemK family protein [Candidatus Brocadia sp. BL1]HQU32134.1 type II toxin-antitoxin system PemK/MazF family toxin [Candidatus Brocadia sapporoensis]